MTPAASFQPFQPSQGIQGQSAYFDEQEQITPPLWF
jgi:hypothetical protein